MTYLSKQSCESDGFDFIFGMICRKLSSITRQT